MKLKTQKMNKIIGTNPIIYLKNNKNVFDNQMRRITLLEM